jgi:predicted RNA-binding protein
MCEARAYLVEGDDARLVMEHVDAIEPEEEGLRLVSIFGDQKFLKARIRSLRLVDNTVFLVKVG